MEQRWDERHELETRALTALANASDLEPTLDKHALRPEIRLWRYPSFALYRSWTVFASRKSPLDETELLVREVAWDRAYDMQRFTNPLQGLRQGFRSPPAIAVRDARLAMAEYRQLLNAAAAVPVQVVGFAARLEIDGISHGLEVDQGSENVRLTWWGDGPPEWKTFIESVNTLRGFFIACLDHA